MKKDVVILVAEDDDGHFWLIKRNLQREGINNRILRFADGQEVLDFLYRSGEGQVRNHDTAYIMLLDIRMPKVDGIGVLEKIKQDVNFRKIPVVMVTTTDNSDDIARSHELGCSLYIIKPVGYEGFVDTICKLARFLMIIEVPKIA